MLTFVLVYVFCVYLRQNQTEYALNIFTFYVLIFFFFVLIFCILCMCDVCAVCSHHVFYRHSVQMDKDNEENKEATKKMMKITENVSSSYS